MKVLTTIKVQDDEQTAWEIYTDDSCMKTIGFIFDEKLAERVEKIAEYENRGTEQ